MGLFQGPFDFNKMPLGWVGCRVLIHAKSATRQSWEFHAKPGFYISPALNCYCCFKLVKSNTKSQVILDTIKFCHSYLSIPVPSAKDKIIHGLQVVAGMIRGAPPPTSVSQLKAITSLQGIFESWRTLTPPSLCPSHCSAPSPPRVRVSKGGRDLTTEYKPHVVSQQPQPAVSSLTPAPSAPTFHVTPHHLVFGNDHSPRVVSEPQQPLLPPSAPVLPVWESIAHCTRSWAPAVLALFASGGQFHECVQYCIPTAKSSCTSPVAMEFVGLCTIHPSHDNS
jgi:hypothetical protein